MATTLECWKIVAKTLPFKRGGVAPELALKCLQMLCMDIVPINLKWTEEWVARCEYLKGLLLCASVIFVY